MMNSLGKDNYDETQWPESTFVKWYGGSRHPEGATYALLRNNFQDSVLVSAIRERLNKNELSEVLRDFGVPLGVGELPNPDRAAYALMMEFRALVDHNGDAENLVPQNYRVQPSVTGFEAYFQKVRQVYSMMSLPGGEDRPFRDCFVCNDLGPSPAVFHNRKTGKTISNATLQTLRSYDARGDTRHLILLGSGGSGKTLLMQHLLLDAVEQHRKTGFFPVFIELRTFSYYNEDLVYSIVKTVQTFDPSFTEDAVLDLLSRGKFQILLDGLDEVDPEEDRHLQRKIREFVQRFPDNQIVISSRDCDVVRGIHGFHHLHLLPFDHDQSLLLIDRLLAEDDNRDAAKSSILSFMEKGFLKRDGCFVSNPMLLTIVVLNYHKLAGFSHRESDFYSLVYETMVSEHDVDKTDFNRLFYSVDTEEQFTEVFSEFCALTYQDHATRFTHPEFQKYFRQLKSPGRLGLLPRCSCKNFQHDVCSSACMMYEQDSDLYYVDPGFQEYLFARYHFFADSEETRNMARRLWHVPPSSYESMAAFDMLAELSSDKAEVCLYLPLLESIFRKKSEMDSFSDFLDLSFNTINYTVLDYDAVKRTFGADHAPAYTVAANVNEPQNVILFQALKAAHAQTSFDLLTTDPDVRFEEYARSFLSARAAKEQGTGEENFVLTPTDKRMLDPDLAKRSMSFQLSSTVYKGQEPVIYGYTYEVASPLSDPVKERSLILMLMSVPGLYDAYTRLRNYYLELKKKQSFNQYH